MAVSTDHFLAQAEICAQAAKTADLPEQRDKYLRSQIAWEALADSEVRIRDARARRSAERLGPDKRTHPE